MTDRVPQPVPSRWPAATGSPGAALVIADSGASAEVVLLPAALTPVIGLRFHHGGVQWEITGRRPHSGTYVAEPLRH